MKTRTDRLKFYCARCGQNTNHEIIRKASRRQDDDSGTVWLDSEWAIIECAGCEEISFAHRTWFSEDCAYDGEIIPSVELFPKRSENGLRVKTFPSVPQTLRRLYSEVIECFNSDSFILCAAGLRALVEGICAEREIWGTWENATRKDGSRVRQKKRNLEGKIEGLVDRNFLTQNHAQTLHQHRFLGNEALHELQVPSIDSLKAAIQILEHTLENLYELNTIAERVRDQKTK